MKYKNPVLILGLYTPGISLLKNFSENGIQVFGADCDKNLYGFKTKYGRKFVCPDPRMEIDKWINWLLKFGETFTEKIIVISTSDRYVLPLIDNLDKFNHKFIYSSPESNLLRKITSKKGMAELAFQYNFPIPGTVFPKTSLDVLDFCKKVSFPIIAKPEFSKDWMTADIEPLVSGNKVKILSNQEEAVKFFTLMQEKKTRIILQEIIEGSDDKLLYQVSYISKKGKALVSFLGKKIRITPIHFGSASYVETVNDQELADKINEFLINCNYTGICGVEVKLDDKDNQYKLIEINPRYGLWDELGIKIDKNIGLTAYKDLADIGSEIIFRETKKIFWYSLHRDIAAFYEYNNEGTLTLRSWLATYKNKPKYISDFQLNDIKTSLYTLFKLFKGIVKIFLSKTKLIRHKHND